MSVEARGPDDGPILPGSPLARVLNGGTVPPLSAGFADRVIAALDTRPAPLPEPRRRQGRWSGWRAGRRLAFGLGGAVALASAAAATGLLRDLALPVPAAGTVWASLAGPARAAPAPRPSAPPVSATPTDAAPTGIAGPIDTPEELGEAFRRVDALRDKRREVRRALLDQRIADELARRRAEGLPEPTPEQIAAFRERIAAAEARRQQAANAAVQARRAELERRVQAGEALTREDLVQPFAGRRLLPEERARLEDLRRMTPQERRAAWQALPPDERAALAAKLRALRAGRAGVPASEPAPAVEPTPAQ